MKQTFKTCQRCRQRKPITEFQRNIHNPDGRQDWCRACYRRNYYARHGGAQRALRRVTDDELLDEILRRSLIRDLMDTLRTDDIRHYLSQREDEEAAYADDLNPQDSDHER